MTIEIHSILSFTRTRACHSCLRQAGMFFGGLSGGLAQWLICLKAYWLIGSLAIFPSFVYILREYRLGNIQFTNGIRPYQL
jgi:hypothetical protein